MVSAWEVSFRREPQSKSWSRHFKPWLISEDSTEWKRSDPVPLSSPLQDATGRWVGKGADRQPHLIVGSTETKTGPTTVAVPVAVIMATPMRTACGLVPVGKLNSSKPNEISWRCDEMRSRPDRMLIVIPLIERLIVRSLTLLEVWSYLTSTSISLSISLDHIVLYFRVEFDSCVNCSESDHVGLLKKKKKKSGVYYFVLEVQPYRLCITHHRWK